MLRIDVRLACVHLTVIVFTVLVYNDAIIVTEYILTHILCVVTERDLKLFKMKCQL